MELISKIIHPSFTLNGLRYDSIEDLLDLVKRLIKDGDDFEINIGKFIQNWLDDDDFIVVKTSGSTGKSKKIRITKQHMINSAIATGTYFNLGEKTSALLCLSAKYIAGKMMLVRAMYLGWDLHIVAPEKDALTQYDNDYDFVAMVPYQLYHSINDLKKVKKLIVGGGVVSNELAEKVQGISTEVYASYGMTETISHIAIKKLNGADKFNNFRGLPNVKFELDSRDCLVIYAPDISEEAILTNDLVELISATEFKWLGRYDNLINSGGFKINPENVEEKLSKFIELPFIIASEKDEELGERLILILENNSNQKIPNYSQAFAFLESYERPKKIYTVSKFPFTQTEKIKREDVLQLVRKYK